MISVLNRAAGFFSQFFFTINHFVYCLKRGINFTLDSSDWTFSYKDGWTDYFLPFDMVFENATENNGRYGHGSVIDDIPYYEYQAALPLIWKYNDFMKEKIKEKMTELELVAGEYDSIFIRRGDKLLCESVFIETEKYIQILLEKNSGCKTIFLQTDDYNCFLDISEYLQKRGLQIRVLTLCNKNLFGFSMSDREFYNTQSNFQENQPYIDKIRDMNVKNKLIFELNKEEMLDHMVTFLVGLEIVLRSNICITDYSSNVARFIKMWNSDSVFHVSGEELDMNRVCCPAY
jgi:hypothetical protein